MQKIIDKLWVGNDQDYLKVKDRPDWVVLRCCKEGPGGHRDTLHYTGQAAPKGKDYLHVDKDNRRALNFIDPHDPHFIPVDMVTKGIEFIDNNLSEGKNVLVACNAGHSRGPTTAMVFLRSIGELTGGFHSSENIFRTLCDAYEPGIGVRAFNQNHWSHFDRLLRKET